MIQYRTAIDTGTETGVRIPTSELTYTICCVSMTFFCWPFYSPRDLCAICRYSSMIDLHLSACI